MNIRTFDKYLLLPISAIILACVVIFLQFDMRDGLWGDELALANNFISEWSTLFKPLTNHQVAPILFLLIEKCFFECANLFEALPDNWLRAYPLCCGMGTIILYYPTILRLSKSRIIALFSLLLLAFAPEFVYYSSEIKQYICELFFTVLLLFVYSYKNDSLKYTLIFCTTVLVGIFNSNVICFALLPMGLYDGWQILRKYKLNFKTMFSDKETKLFCLRYSLCLLFLVVYYLLFLCNHPQKEYMNNYWDNYFITTQNISHLMDWNLRIMYFDIKVKIINWLFVAGLISLLFIKNKFLFVFSVVLIGTHIVFSYFKLYPVSGRLILYWYSVTAVVFGNLLYRILKIIFYPLKKKYAEILITLIGVLLIAAYWLYYYPKLPLSFHRSSDKPILIALSKEYKPNDFAVLDIIGYGKYSRYYFQNPYPFYHDSFFRSDDKELEIETSVPLDKDLPEMSNKILNYSIWNKKLYKYNRLWVCVRTPNKKAVEHRLNKLIEQKQSGQNVEKCDIVSDMTLCLIKNKEQK